MSESVKLVEVFSSLQGEGFRVGERQVFVRLAVCDMKCAYCDTPESIGAAPAQARIQTSPEVHEFEMAPNPMHGEDLGAAIDRLAAGARRPVVSVTGGEPLLQVAFLERWFAVVRDRYELVLETHGRLPRALARVVEHLDEVVMDVKVPSATREPAAWGEHAEFLDVALGADVALTVKAVVSNATTEEELEEILSLFARAGAGARCVLQPVTFHPPDGARAPALKQLLEWQTAAFGRGLDVRVVPQVHITMGAL